MEYVLLAAFVAAVVAVGFVLPEFLGQELVGASTHMQSPGGSSPGTAALPPIRAGVVSELPSSSRSWIPVAADGAATRTDDAPE